VTTDGVLLMSAVRHRRSGIPAAETMTSAAIVANEFTSETTMASSGNMAMRRRRVATQSRTPDYDVSTGLEMYTTRDANLDVFCTLE